MTDRTSFTELCWMAVALTMMVVVPLLLWVMLLTAALWACSYLGVI